MPYWMTGTTGRQWTLDELREALALNLGPWLAGTCSQPGDDYTIVYDSRLEALLLEDNLYKRSTLRVPQVSEGVSTWQERRISAYTSASQAFTVAPGFSVVPTTGVQWELMVTADYDQHVWAINRAIEDAAPDLYDHRVGTLAFASGTYLYDCPAGCDEVIGLEAAALLSGDGYHVVPVGAYEVQSLTIAGEDASQQRLTFRRPLADTQEIRVHYKRYFRPLTHGSEATRLDKTYILARAEEHLRRHIIGRDRGGSLVRHHSELLVDARALAEARKARLAAGLAGTRPAPAKKE